MIRFDDVTYTYPFQSRPAVEHISLHVAPGEIVLCTGASGCGKSTLLRLANGLCPKYYQGFMQGDVRIGGRSTRDQSLPELARRAGTLFQDPEQQFFALGVEDELVFALEWQGWSGERMQAAVAQAVRDFRLESLLSSSVHELSEGQKQMVGLATICTQEPAALILDEPTANLDPEATADLALRLQELRARGMAILVVDHRLYWLEGIADRVLVMSQGRICEQGDFSLLHDADLRQRYGLRAVQVRDVRSELPDSQEGTPLLESRQLHFAHKGRAALYDNATFSLSEGVTALIGQNGAGKTTLARLLAGLDLPQQGEICLDGIPLDARERLRSSGLVLQNADHQLHMRTVRQELEMCLYLAGIPDKGRVDALLESFALSALASRHPQSLSGGEKQRLVIACALAKKPRLLILDEPTSGLDGSNMRRLAALLEQQQEEKCCLLLITHDLELLELMGQKALRLPLQ